MAPFQEAMHSMFGRLLLPLLGAFFIALPLSAQAAQPLLSPAELAARLSQPQVRIVDIRQGGRDGKAPYQAGHLPGAVAAPYAKWRGPADNPGRLPSEEALTELLQSLGVDRSTPVVIVGAGVDETDFGAAARVYWTLKTAGVDQVSILNGGQRAWVAARLPLTTEPASVARSSYSVRIDRRYLATEEDVAQLIGRPAVTLLDARPRAFFEGAARHAAARSPGTLIGAKNVDHSVWFFEDSARLRDAVELRRIAAEQGIETDRPTVSFCNTGHWAATNWFVLSEVLGHPNVTLYPESVVAWSQSGRQMANVPGRLRQFWLQLKEASGAS